MPSKYTDEQRAAVIAERLAGATLGELAKRHGIPKTTVALWLKERPVQPVRVPDGDLAERFGRSVYNRALEALDALGAHLRAAAAPEFAQVPEGWTTRAESIAQIVVTLGSAIQQGRDEPIRIDGTVIDQAIS